MSAVSSGSPQGSAEVRAPVASREPGSTHQPASAPQHGSGPDPAAGQADFGANEWLVEELYQRYLADPGSVDMAWWSFFSDYQPPRGGAPRGEGQSGVLSPPRPAAPDAQPPAQAGAPPADAARTSSPAGP